MKPFSTAFDHSFAFCRELAKVGCEDGGSDDRARHGGLEQLELEYLSDDPPKNK
jgi:hypothetical protein